MGFALPPVAFVVSVNDVDSKIIDGADGPALSVGFNLKLPIADLLDALQKWQKNVQQDAACGASAAQSGSLQAARLPGSLTSSPSSITQMTDISHKPVTWDTDIRDLQPGGSHVERQDLQWNATNVAHPQYILQDAYSRFDKLDIKRFTWEPPVKTATSHSLSAAEKNALHKRASNALYEAEKAVETEKKNREASEVQKQVKRLVNRSVGGPAKEQPAQITGAAMPEDSAPAPLSPGADVPAVGKAPAAASPYPARSQLPPGPPKSASPPWNSGWNSSLLPSGPCHAKIGFRDRRAHLQEQGQAEQAKEEPQGKECQPQ